MAFKFPFHGVYHKQYTVCKVPPSLRQSLFRNRVLSMYHVNKTLLHLRSQEKQNVTSRAAALPSSCTQGRPYLACAHTHANTMVSQF